MLKNNTLSNTDGVTYLRLNYNYLFNNLAEYDV